MLLLLLLLFCCCWCVRVRVRVRVHVRACVLMCYRVWVVSPVIVNAVKVSR